MTWLIVAIIAYFLLAISCLLDKCLLSGGIPSPALYVFYNGVFSATIFILAPFVDFSIPNLKLFFYAFLTGAIFMIALYWFYKALSIFEVSRVAPIIGALSPIFSFCLIFFTKTSTEIFDIWRFGAFSLLVLGSFFIVYEKTKISLKSFFFSTIASFFFALFFILQKNAFEMFGSFFNTLIWMSVGSFFVAILFFIFSLDVRKKVFAFKKITGEKTIFTFLINKTFSGLGGFLQRMAIFLAPSFIEVPLVQGLQGIQYVFLFLMTIFFTKNFPKIVKEKISKEIIIKKFVAIIFIGLGLVILIFSK